MFHGQKNFSKHFKNSQVFSYGGASLTGDKRLLKYIDAFTNSANENTLFITQVGTNDLLDKKRTPQEIVSKYKEFLQALKNKSTSNQICVLGLLPVISESLKETAKRKDLNKLLHCMANEENVLFLSTWNTFALDPNYKSLFNKKGLHLSDLGNSTLTNLLSNFIKNFPSIPANQFLR